MSRLNIYAVTLAAGLLVGVGCSRNNSQTGEASREVTPAKNTGTAFVRYVNAVGGHSNTTLYFGDTELFSSAEAQKPTAYKQVPAERRDFILREAAKPTGMEIAKNSEGLGDGKHYTVVAFEDTDTKPVLRVFNDDESAPAAGKAKVRLIHAAPGVEPVGLYTPRAKDKLAGESRFNSGSSWQEVNPVNGPLEIRTGDHKNVSRVTVPDHGIEAGKFYTLIVEGGAKTGEKLHVVELVDTPTAL